MRQAGRFTFLGTGASMGVPLIGCVCEVCSSVDPCNRRLRPSALVQINDKTLLIDPGPDFREQALREKVDHLDGVLVTHTHYDHVGGIDDLRIFFFRNQLAVPCLLSKNSLKDLKSRLIYLFEERSHSQNVTAQLDFRPLPQARGQVEFLDLPIGYTTYRHGGMLVNGFRFGNLAYITDIYDYPETIFEDLQGVETLVLSALRYTKSHVHFSVPEAIDFAEKVAAKQTWLTHIAHDLEHRDTNTKLPEYIQLAHDGLELHFYI